ncbi:MAG: PIN domain-containing protein [Rhodothermales bacterium]
MRVYLDTCAVQRPLDDRTQLRIRFEAEAILSVLDLVRAGRVELVSSDVLQFETEQNPRRTRREYALGTLAGAATHLKLTDEVRRRAEALNRRGLRTLDALHLASAEASEADFFCTCDDTFLKKAKRETRDPTRVVAPMELAEELERWASRHDR